MIKLIVFHGGFTREQVLKLRNNKYVIYKKSNYNLFRINQKNTFKYYTIDEKSKEKEKIENIIDENYKKQWIHCFKYLENALYYCEEQYNYVVAFNLLDEVLEKYKGVCDVKYEGYKIEYRIPRSEIKSIDIIDVFKFDYFKPDIVEKLKQRYPDNYSGFKEHEEAKKYLKNTKQKCKYI